MPESLVHRGGSLILGPSGSSLFRTVEGVPGSCCCGCSAYFKATLCNETCVGEPDSIYVCENSFCPAGDGGYTGPIQHGKIVKVGARCYRVDGRTRYCPPDPFRSPNPFALRGPAIGGGDPVPIPCIPMPPGAVIAGVQRCENDCVPPHCGPVQGWYKMRACSNTPPFGLEAYVCCELYEEARQTHACPVFGACGSMCWYVEPGTVPTTEPPPVGAGRYCTGNPPVAASCCECCQVSSPGCCTCSSPSVVHRPGGCGYIEEVFPIICQTWDENASLQGGGHVLVLQDQGLPQLCPVQLTCFRAVPFAGAYAIEIRSYQFLGDCTPGPAVSCSSGVCGVSLPYALFGGGEPIIGQIVPRCTPAGGLVLPNITGGVGGGGTPPCCVLGQRLMTCRQGLSNMARLGNASCGQEIRECFDYRWVSSPGTCGDDACGGAGTGMILLDGSPASDIGKLADAGCSGCTGAKGERL